MEGKRWCEEGGKKRVLGWHIVNESQIEISKWKLQVMRCFILFSQVTWKCWLIWRCENIIASSQIEGIVRWLSGFWARKKCGLSSCIVIPKYIMFVYNMKLRLRQRFLISSEMVYIVPSHGVHISLANFFSQDFMVFPKKRVKIFVSNEVLLLDYLSIDVRGSECLDLSNKEISDSFNSLYDSINTMTYNIDVLIDILTVLTSWSSRGFRSEIPLMFCSSFALVSKALDRFSTSFNATTHVSSMTPSDIFFTTAGETVISSTIGPSPLSTTFRFSSRRLNAVDLACSVSISAETAPRSFWKLVRLISTEFRISSHARIDRWRSSNFVLSLSSVYDEQI